jgi:hypothetical protein
MGWKSTVTISRVEAATLIQDRLINGTNDELADAMGVLYGDNPELPYFGRNFMVE